MADPVSFTIAMVAQVGISFLFPSEGPRLKDLKISASTYGAAIPEVYGHARVPGNLIWSDQIREHKRKTMAGKGGFVNQYTYSCSFAMGLCRGPITRVLKLWANNKLIYDGTGASSVVNHPKYRIRFYRGSETQVPDSAMTAILGEDNSPAFRGLCYVMFDNLPLADFGNQLPQITAEVFGLGDLVATAQGPNYQSLGGDVSSAGAQGGEETFDPNKGYVYRLVYAPDGAYIRRFRLSDGHEDGQFPFDGASSLVATSPSTGAIFYEPFIGINATQLVALEPVGFQKVASFGSTVPFSGDGIEYIIENGTFATVTSPLGGVDEWMAVMGEFGGWEILRTAKQSQITIEDYQVVGRATGGFDWGRTRFIGMDTEDFPVFYAWDGANSAGGYVDAVRLWKIEGRGGSPDSSGKTSTTWTVTNIHTRPNPIPEVGGINIGFGVGTIHRDDSDGGLLLIWTEPDTAVSPPKQRIGKFDLNLNEFRWITDASGKGFPEAAYASTTASGRFMWIGGNKVWVINTTSGEWVSTDNDIYDQFVDDPAEAPLASLLPTPTANYAGLPILSPSAAGDNGWYDPARDAFVQVGRAPFSTFDIGKIIRAGWAGGFVTLSSIVETVLRRGGLTGENFDLTLLQSVLVRGYGWASSTDVKGVIDQLRRLYLFDLVETGGKLKAVSRDNGSNEDAPGTPVRKVVQKVLGSSAEDAMDFWQETRVQESDLPARVSLTYMNWDDDFQSSTARSARLSDPIPTMFSRQQVAMEINVVMTGTEAKNQVNKMLWSQWTERTKHSTRLPWAYLNLDPADIINVKMDDGRSYQDRITSMEFGADLALAVETFTRDEGAYESEMVGDAGGGGGSTPIQVAPPARPFILNTPLLRDQDDTGGSYSLYYTGVGSETTDPFDGASLFRGLDNNNYALLYGTDNDVEWGIVRGALPAPRRGHFVLDWDNRLTIFPGSRTFELESITDDQLWNGANLCVIGNEVIQFRDCVQNADSSWTIWNLLRGRRGTEYACDNHAIAERFVFPTPSTIGGEGDTLDSRGQKRFFKAVGQGRALSQATPVTVVYEPRDQMPYAPKDIRRDISGVNVTLTWRRRTRFGGNMQDGTGTVPLHETSEQYEVYILSQPFTGDLSRGNTVPLDAVLASAVVSGQTATFDTSGFTAAFDVNLDTLHVLIYQISATVGRGFPGVRSIEPWRVF
jgi:hypothetical protein